MAAFLVAARYRVNPSPAATPFGVPRAGLRVVDYQIDPAHPATDELARRFRELNVDVLLLHGIEARQLASFAATWADGRFAPSQAYYPAQDIVTPDLSYGSAILSRYPLYEARPIPNPMNSAIGVWAVGVADGQRFYLASAALSSSPEKDWSHLIKAWQAMGSPPLVLGATGWIRPGEALTPIAGTPLFVSMHWIGAVDAKEDVYPVNLKNR